MNSLSPNLQRNKFEKDEDSQVDRLNSDIEKAKFFDQGMKQSK